MSNDAIARLLLQIETSGTAQLDAAIGKFRAVDAEAMKLNSSAGALVGFADGAAKTAIAVGALATGIELFSTREAAQFQKTITDIRNNTQMTDAQFQQMRETILHLGADTGAPLDQLAQGFMRVTNMGYSGAAALQVLRAGMESALSTGTNIADVVNTLASVMHAFGVSNDQAAQSAFHYMDVLHVSANLGNMTLAEMAQNFGIAASYAAALGVPIEDVAAALAVMTRNGLDAFNATTQIKDLMVHMLKPSKDAKDQLAELSRTTGVDLVHDFSQGGLAGKGLVGVIEDIRKATQGNAAEMLRLIPNLRGFLGELILTGKGLNDYKNILEQLKLANGQTADAFQRQQATFSAELARTERQFQELAITIGTILLPIEQQYLADLAGGLHTIDQWIGEHQQLTAHVLEAATVFGLLGLALKSGIAVGGLYVQSGMALVSMFQKLAGATASAAAAQTAMDVASARGATGGLQWMAQLGDSAAVSTPKVDAFGRTIDKTLLSVGGLQVYTGMLPGELATTGTSAEAAGVGFGAMGLGSALAVTGIGALLAGLVIFAEVKSPAVRQASAELADAIGVKLQEAAVVGINGLDAMGTHLDALGSRMDSFTKQHKSFFDSLGSLGQMAFQGLTQEGPFGSLPAKGGNFLDQHGQRPQGPQWYDNEAGRFTTPEKVAQQENRRAATDAGGMQAAAAQQFDLASKQADAALKALAYATLSNSDAQGVLRLSAIGLVAANNAMQDALLKSKEVVDLAAGDFAGALDAMTQRLQHQTAEAMAELTLAIIHHAGNIHSLAEQAAGDEKKQQAVSAAQAEASRLVAAITGQEVNSKGKLISSTKALQTAFDALTQNVDNKDKQALSDLAMALLSHKKNLDSLTAAAGQAEARKRQVEDAGIEAQIRAARAAGDFATVLDLQKQKLQNASNNAQARLVEDERSGAPSGTISRDKTRVDETGHQLDLLNRQIKDAAASGKRLDETFKQLADDADKKAQAALDRLEMAMEKGARGQEVLTEKAAAAAIAVEKKGKIEADAGIRVDLASRQWQAALDAMEKKSKDVADDGMAHLIIALHNGATHVDGVADAAVRQERGSKRWEEATQRAALITDEKTGQWKAALDILTGRTQQFADDSLAHLILATEEGKKNLSELGDKAAFDAEQVDRHARVEQQAALMIAEASGHVSDAIKLLGDEINGLVDQLASELVNGTSKVAQNTETGNQARHRAGAVGATLGPGDVETRGDAILKKIEQLYEQQYRLQTKLTQAQYDAAIATGQFADALRITEDQVKTKFDNAVAKATLDIMKHGEASQKDILAIQKAANEQERQSLATQAANRIATDAEIRAAQAAGDFGHALDLIQQQITGDVDQAWKSLVDHFLTGAGDLNTLLSTYQVAEMRQKALTQATIDAYIATGQFSEALKEITGQATTAYDESLASVTKKLHDHERVTQSEIDSVKANKAVVDGWTQAQWDATFATSDLATQSKMLSERFSHLVSESNGIQSSQDKVNQAELTIIADQSSIAVGLLQDIGKGIEDETAVISAMSALATAYGDGQVTAVKDQTSIISAQTDVLKATTAQEQQLALDRLQAARDQYSVDQQAARWNQVIATQQVRIAIEKMNADRMESAARAIVDQAKLKVDQDALKLAEDDQKLSSDMLVILNDIDSNLGSVNDYGQLIRDDLAMIGADSQQASTDQQALALDTARQQQLAAENAARLAQDEQQLAIDQASAAASSVQGQMKLALDGQKIAADTLAQQQQIASILQANNTQQITILEQQLDAYKKFFAMFTGGSRAGRQRGLAGGGLLNQFTVDSHGGQAQ